jgi:hypothetical protein
MEEPEGSPERERAMLLLRIVDVERIGFYDAERWLRAWEAKAAGIGRSPDSESYWVEGRRWIEGELAAERRTAN